MKKLLAVFMCVLLLATGTMSVSAINFTVPTTDTTVSNGDQTTTEPDDDQTTTEPDDDQTTTEPDGDQTTTEPDPTTSGDVTRVKTSVIITYNTEMIQMTVFSAEGMPLVGVPVVLSVDGEAYSLTTNENGAASVTVTGEFYEIIGTMVEFQRDNVIYEASAASAVRQVATAFPTGSDVTTLPTVPTTAKPRPSFSGATFSTTDPALNTTESLVTTTTVSTTQVSGEDNTNKNNRNVALLFFVLGGVLLICAALAAYFLLIRKKEDDEEEAEPEVLLLEDTEGEDISEELVQGEETAVPLFEEQDTTDEITLESEEMQAESEEPKSVPIIGEKTVSLEDLFRDE